MTPLTMPAGREFLGQVLPETIRALYDGDRLVGFEGLTNDGYPRCLYADQSFMPGVRERRIALPGVYESRRLRDVSPQAEGE